MTWIFVALLVVGAASGFGIKPAQTSLTYVEDTVEEHVVRVVNAPDNSLALHVYVVGEIADYIIIPEPFISFDTLEYAVPYQVNMSVNLKPGLRVGKIIFEEPDPYVTGSIGTRLKLAHKISIAVPYPEKYVEPETSISVTDKAVIFDTAVSNLGSLYVGKVQARHTILEGNEELMTLYSSAKSLAPLQLINLISSVDRRTLPDGRYLLERQVQYDGQSQTKNITFLVGNPAVGFSIPNIYFDNISVSKFDIVLENLWNERLEGVHTEMTIRDAHYNLANISTYSIDLEPRQKERVYAYWDSRGIPYGEYIADVTIYFNDESLTKEFKVSVISPEEYAKLVRGRTDVYYILLLIVLIIVTAVFAYHLWGKKQKTRKKRNV